MWRQLPLVTRNQLEGINCCYIIALTSSLYRQKARREAARAKVQAQMKEAEDDPNFPLTPIYRALESTTPQVSYSSLIFVTQSHFSKRTSNARARVVKPITMLML